MNGGMIDAIESGAAEVRQSVIQCLLLGVGLPVGLPVRTHPLDPLRSSQGPIMVESLPAGIPLYANVGTHSDTQPQLRRNDAFMGWP